MAMAKFKDEMRTAASKKTSSFLFISFLLWDWVRVLNRTETKKAWGCSLPP
jgi:hypothetical protein